jgi:ribose 5-phosphate isomerase B
MLYLGADHRGFEMKEEIKKYLDEKKIVFEDLGNGQYDKTDDFPIFARLVTIKIAEDFSAHRGILFCGSGAGMSIVANRTKGIRAGLCVSEKMVEADRQQDDINVLILPTNFVDLEMAKNIVDKFLNTNFQTEERYLRRIKMLDN